MLLGLLCFSLQGSFSSARFFGPFRQALVKEHNGPQQFISRLFRPKRVLSDLVPIMRPFTLWALPPGHETYLAEWSWFSYGTLFRLFRQAEWTARSECQYMLTILRASMICLRQNLIGLTTTLKV
jgi:hypothetical protein